MTMKKHEVPKTGGLAAAVMAAAMPFAGLKV